MPPPVPHMAHSLNHGISYYTAHSPLHSPPAPHPDAPTSLSASNNGQANSGGSGIPTYAELKRHYEELHEERKRLDELVEKNERMLGGVKRGLEEMRAGGLGVGMGLVGGAALALNLMREGDRERPRSRASVWPLEAGRE